MPRHPGTGAGIPDRHEPTARRATGANVPHPRTASDPSASCAAPPGREPVRSDSLVPAPALPAFSCAILVAGIFGLLPEVVAAALAVAVSASVHGGSLLRHCWRGRRSGLPLPLHCPPGLLGLGLLGTGATVASAAGVTRASDLTAVLGLILCAGLFLAALQVLPGAEGRIGRLASLLEGLSLGAGGLYATWLLFLAGRPVSRDACLVAATLVIGCALPVTVVSAVAAWRRYPAVAYCHLGVLLCLLGLADFAILAEGRDTGRVPVAVPVAATLMIFSGVLIWYGVRHLPERGRRPNRPAPVPVRLLLATAAPAAVVGATVIQVAGGRRVDGVALSLALALLLLLAARESLARLRIRAQRSEIGRLRARLHGAGTPPRATGGYLPDHDGDHQAGPVSRRRLLAAVRARLADGDHQAALIMLALPPGHPPVGVAAVQAVAGARHITAATDEGYSLVLVEGGPASAATVAARLLDAFAPATLTRSGTPPAPVTTGATGPGRAAIGGMPGPSIGIAEFADAGTVGGLLDRARLACERAARQGTGVEWFDAEHADADARRRLLGRHLPAALAGAEFALQYQPVVDLRARWPVGARVTVRWRSPELGLVEPDEFLPVAAETGRLDELGRWVLADACRHLARWGAGGRPLWLLLRGLDGYLLDPALPAALEAALASHGVPPAQLTLEIGEGSAVGDTALAYDQLSAVRAVGARTGLAGWGTAGPAFAQLRRLPIDVLTLTSAGEDKGFAEAILAVRGTRQFGVDLVVDGVATPADLARLRTAGCALVTGPVFGPPGPAERFEAVVHDFRYPPDVVTADVAAGGTTLAR